MFNKRKKAKRTPESRTAYLTTIDGAFADDGEDAQVVNGTLGNTDEDQRYADVRPHGAHDAAGRAGGPKGSVRFGEGDASAPRYFSMDPNSGDHRGDTRHQTRPANADMVDDIEQRIVDAAGSRGADGAAHEDKAIRARGSLIVAVVLAVILVIALFVCVSLALTEAAEAETQQTQVSGAVMQPAGTQLGAEKAPAAKPERAVTTSVPVLQTLIGGTQKQAISKLGHGAEVSRVTDYTDEQSHAVQRVTVVLTSEPSNGSQTPTVYLDLNSDGTVVGASYQVSMASLGYGAISFKQAAGKSKVVQNTLADAGVAINDDSGIVLPKRAKDYSTYKSDGKTLVRQSRSFSGDAKSAGMSYHWTGSLEYDFSKANKSGNLVDTQRIVRVGITV